MHLFIDFETQSVVDLKKVGVVNYINHPSTEIVCTAYSTNDEYFFEWGFLNFDFKQPDLTIIAHNVFFEQACIKKYIPNILNYKNITWIDTMALAAINNVRMGLAQCAGDLGLEMYKHDGGAKIMRKLNRGGDFQSLTSDEKANLKEYCIQDVKLCITIYNKLISSFPKNEQKFWALTNKYNWQGVNLDLPLARKAADLLEDWQEKVPKKVSDLTDGKITSINQALKLSEFLKLPDIRAGRLREVLEVETDPLRIELIKLRLEGGKKSVAKFKTALDIQSEGKLYDTMLYHAAATGRFSSKGMQLQNLLRGDKQKADQIIEKIKSNSLDSDFLSLPSYLSYCVRGLIVPPSDHILVKADYAQIEARILAWLANDNDLLQKYRRGVDLYKEMAAKIFRKNSDQVTFDERFYGKSAVLGCGYGMGAKKFAATYKIDDELALTSVNAYRKHNQKICGLWKEMETAFYRAYQGQFTKVGRCIFHRDKWRLMVKLPSGRNLIYPFPEMRENKIFHKTRKQGQFVEVSYWGGTLTENICQAISRDLLCYAMWHLRKNEKYHFMFTVHDELVYSCNPNNLNTTEFADLILSSQPKWSDGIPLEVEVETHDRYFK